MRSNTNENTDGIIDTPLYVVEAKRFEGAQSNLFSLLPQHFEQLRHICIKYSLPYCNGVFTNFHQWYFARYNLSHEIESVGRQKSFEVSREFNLFSV
jgi:hypothetical protein